LACAALALTLVTVVLGVRVRSLQDSVESGRLSLVKAQTFATIDNNLIQLLANTAAQKNDTQLRALLAANGVTFQDQAAAPASSAAPSDSSVAKAPTP
jgi:hypothetical protein